MTDLPRPLRLGLLPPTNAPALKLADVLTGSIPAHPLLADHFKGNTFGIYENNLYGVCGPTGAANHLRMVSAALLGVEIVPSQSDVFDLYQRSGNPQFNPATGTDDNGVVLQTMLAALLAGGIGNGKGQKIKPVAYARVDVTSDDELEAAASIFGALWGVELQVAQQAQSSQNPPLWDYDATAIWGGHCVMNGKYEPTATPGSWTMANAQLIASSIQTGVLGTPPRRAVQPTDIDVLSWAIDIPTTQEFRQHQLQEAWVIVWPWLLTHPAFQAGVNLADLRSAFKSLTGRQLAA